MYRSVRVKSINQLRQGRDSRHPAPCHIANVMVIKTVDIVVKVQIPMFVYPRETVAGGRVSTSTNTTKCVQRVFNSQRVGGKGKDGERCFFYGKNHIAFKVSQLP